MTKYLRRPADVKRDRPVTLVQPAWRRMYSDPAAGGSERWRQSWLPYYKAKREAEQVLEADGSADDCTIQRITQFHDLLDTMLGMRVVPLPKATSFQPVDVGEAADRVVELVASEPQGRATDLAGPEVLSVGELARIRREQSGRRALIVPAPAVGPLRDLAAGVQLAGPDALRGVRTWSQFQQQRRAPG